MAASLPERITQSFYAWETRGRGWTLADYPVSLEPPHRPFFVLPEIGATHKNEDFDDGKRPTLLSSLIDGMNGLLAPRVREEEVEPFEEQPPFPVLPHGSLVALRILVPSDYEARADVSGRLLLALSAAVQPVSVEFIGHAGIVSMQIVCAEADRDHVLQSIEGYIPEASILESDDVLAQRWDASQENVVIDFGLADEFFLPLQTLSSLHIDPYIPLVAALAQARSHEMLTLQILFERVRNPWGKTILSAVSDGNGGSIFNDAPEFVPLAKAKTAQQLFAVSLRVAAQAASEARAWNLARSTNAFVLQFANPGGNSLIPLENDGYSDRSHEAALLTRQSFRTGMILSADELLTLVHLPDQSVRHEALLRDVKRTKACPPWNAGSGSLVLGMNVHRGEQKLATVPDEARFAHAWIVGGSGTGKSTLLLNLIHQDIAQGHGLAVLDPHGDLIEDILARIPKERMHDVIVFDPADSEWPVGFNILHARSEIERNLLASDLVAIFKRFATSWGDTMSTVLGNAVLAILSHPEGGTLIDLRHFLVDERYRKQYLAEIPDPDIRFFWEKEYHLVGTKSIGPILSRLDTFLRSRMIRHIVGQKEAKLDIAAAMNSGKVFLAKLSKGLIGEENAFLLGSLLVAKCNQCALLRQEIPKEKRRPFFLYADEFQNFITPSLDSLAVEARKYRVGLTLAHQMLAQLRNAPQLEDALLGNCHTRIVFRVGESDARKLADGFAFFEADDLLHLGRGEAIARIGGAANDFNLKTFPAELISGEKAEERSAQVIAASRQRYAVPVAELMRTLEQAHERTQDVPHVVDVSPVYEVAPALPIETLPIKKTIPRVIPVDPQLPGRGGETHKYLQHLIKRLAEERGFRALIEDAAGDGRADVVLKRDKLTIGCEISITTNVLHEIGNLKKCISAGFNRVLFIAPEKRQREKVSAALKKELPDAPIDVIGPEDIVATLDALTEGTAMSESVVRGYKVKVTRQALSPEELSGKRAAIAGVIARTMRTKG